MGDYTARTSRAYTDDDGMLSHKYIWPKYPTMIESELPKPAMTDRTAEMEAALAESEAAAAAAAEPRAKTGGRQKGTPNKFTRIDIMKAARIYSLQMLGTLVDIALDEDEPGAVRVSAANAVLDRAHGKAKQITEIGGVDGGDIQTKLTIEFIGAPGQGASVQAAVPQVIDGAQIIDGAVRVVPQQAGVPTKRPWEE